VKLKIVALLAFAALSVVAAGTARADSAAPAPDGSAVCSTDALFACDTPPLYVECYVDGAAVDVQPGDDIDTSTCDPLFIAYPDPPQQPTDAGTQQPTDDGTYTATGTSTVDLPVGYDPASGGMDVGLGFDPNINPDPSQYGTEIQCPDGSVWAVAIGDQFVCPAA